MSYPERWRPIAGFDYEVSDTGRVRNSRTGRVLRPGPQASGHLTVVLGRGNTRLVHRLVAAAFIGPCPAGHEVRHRNDDPTHNEAGNLIYGTRRENNQDKKWNKGQSNFVLSVEDAREIKRRLHEGESGVSLSWDFGTSTSGISAIKHGRYHADV